MLSLGTFAEQVESRFSGAEAPDLLLKATRVGILEVYHVFPRPGTEALWTSRVLPFPRRHAPGARME